MINQNYCFYSLVISQTCPHAYIPTCHCPHLNALFISPCRTTAGPVNRTAIFLQFFSNPFLFCYLQTLCYTGIITNVHDLKPRNYFPQALGEITNLLTAYTVLHTWLLSTLKASSFSTLISTLCPRCPLVSLSFVA